MGISLNRFNAKTVTPTMDARINEHSMPTNGVFNGMVMTHLGSNQVQITAGNGIIKGRDFDVTLETLLVQLSASGTMNGRIYIRINLSDAVTPIQILSVCAATLPALTQDANFNESNGIWEEELATYSATTTLISGLTTTIKTISNPLIDFIKNANTVTESGFMADARQLNPNVAGSFANTVNESLNGKNILTAEVVAAIGGAFTNIGLSESFETYKKIKIIIFNTAYNRYSHIEIDVDSLKTGFDYFTPSALYGSPFTAILRKISTTVIALNNQDTQVFTIKKVYGLYCR